MLLRQSCMMSSAEKFPRRLSVRAGSSIKVDEQQKGRSSQVRLRTIAHRKHAVDGLSSLKRQRTHSAMLRELLRAVLVEYQARKTDSLCAVADRETSQLWLVAELIIVAVCDSRHAISMPG